MEISAIKTYARRPERGDFPVGTETLAVEWDKSVFTARFIASLYDEVRERQAAVLAEIKALDEELRGADETKAAELSGRVIHLRAEIEEIEQRVYARALAEDILLSWGVTSGGEPVPVSSEFLMRQPREFAADLFAFCRRESLPKVAEKKTGTRTGESPTTLETSPSSTTATPTTRRRRGRRGSHTPTSSPSPAASGSASPS